MLEDWYQSDTWVASLFPNFDPLSSLIFFIKQLKIAISKKRFYFRGFEWKLFRNGLKKKKKNIPFARFRPPLVINLKQYKKRWLNIQGCKFQDFVFLRRKKENNRKNGCTKLPNNSVLWQISSFKWVMTIKWHHFTIYHFVTLLMITIVDLKLNNHSILCLKNFNSVQREIHKEISSVMFEQLS